MNQRLLVTLLTVFGFAAGFAARVWTENERPLPPPPAPLLGEFSGAQPAEKKSAQTAPKPYNRAELLADIEKLRPQIDAYRNRLETIDREYEEGFVQLLTPEQRPLYDVKLAEIQKRRAEHESKAASAPPPPPLSEEEIAKLRQRPFEIAFWKVSFTGRLEAAARDFKLDAQQEAAARQLLVQRRDKFLALVDSTPPPTFKLTVLATSVQRLVEPTGTHAHQAEVKPAK